MGNADTRHSFESKHIRGHGRTAVDIPSTGGCLRLIRIARSLLLLSSLTVGQAAADDTLELTRTLPLLGGRLTISLPAAAESSARPAEDIMSAGPSEKEESRIFVPVDGGRLTVFVEETYFTAPKMIDKELRGYWKGQKPDASPTMFDVGKIRVVAQGVTRWAEVVKGGELAEAALLVLPDQTVVRVGFFVTPKYNDRDRLREVARASLRTITFERTISTSEGVDVGGIYVPLSEGWIHTIQRGPDFRVHSFVHLTPWGTVAPDVGIYVGAHASYLHKQRGVRTRVTKENGRWLGSTVTWHISRGKVPTHEAIITMDGGIRHVWYSGGPEAKALVEAMKPSTQ